MLDKKINLEQILKDNCVNIRFLKTMLSADGIKGSQGQRILDAMKDLSEQEISYKKQALDVENSVGFFTKIFRKSLD